MEIYFQQRLLLLKNCTSFSSFSSVEFSFKIILSFHASFMDIYF